MAAQPFLSHRYFLCQRQSYLTGKQQHQRRYAKNHQHNTGNAQAEQDGLVGPGNSPGGKKHENANHDHKDPQ